VRADFEKKKRGYVQKKRMKISFYTPETIKNGKFGILEKNFVGGFS
jgi:hypothetical protein